MHVSEDLLFLLTPVVCCLSRVRLSGMKIMRPPVAIGHYKMIKHKGDRGNEQNPRRYTWTHSQTHKDCVEIFFPSELRNSHFHFGK